MVLSIGPVANRRLAWQSAELAARMVERSRDRPCREALVPERTLTSRLIGGWQEPSPNQYVDGRRLHRRRRRVNHQRERINWMRRVGERRRIVGIAAILDDALPRLGGGAARRGQGPAECESSPNGATSAGPY